jgi:hypothetical protein
MAGHSLLHWYLQFVMPEIGQCKLCDRADSFIKCHVFPKWSHRLLGAPFGLIISGVGDHAPKKAPNGIYDSKMVCDSCERTFDQPDRYAKRFFVDRDWRSPTLRIHDDFSAHVVHDADCTQLRMFVLNTLWRCAVTGHQYCEKLDLGSRLTRLTDLVRARDTGSFSEFPILLQRLRTSEARPELDPVAVNEGPHTYVSDGRRVACMCLAGFRIHCCVDSRGFDGVQSKFSLNPGLPLIVLETDILSTNFIKRVVRSVARSDHWRPIRPDVNS